jgi:hypothetical protein
MLRKTMYIQLSRELELYAHAQVADGQYATITDCVENMLRKQMLTDIFYREINRADKELFKKNGKLYSESYIQALQSQAIENVKNNTLTHSALALPL